ncbi:hypothetical protein CICLE_v100271402mg, partial [Citrus x clementina]
MTENRKILDGSDLD